MNQPRLSFILFLLSFSFMFFAIQDKSVILMHPSDRIQLKVVPDSVFTLKISVVGDLMCHAPQYNSARIAKTDSFNFNPVFSKIKPYLVKSDFTCGNLETVISKNNNNLSGYPNFNSPEEFLSALKNSGFDILFTANNHSLDRGRSGVVRTIAQIKSAKMNSVGTYLSKRDRDSIRIFKKNGISFALLAYTYGTNGYRISKKNNFLISTIDKQKIKADLLKADKYFPDLVIVYFHFGNEYQRFPSKFQKEIVKFAIKNGADIILGSHPHVLQPVEKFKSLSGRVDSGLVAYSLGNFISNQRWRYSDAGGILNISINKSIENDSTYISSLSFLPTWVYKGIVNRKVKYQILPSGSGKKVSEYFSKEDSINMSSSFSDAQKIIKLEMQNLKLLR